MKNVTNQFVGLVAMISILCVMAASATCCAQDEDPKNDTLEWRYTSIENKVLNERILLSGKFISYGGNKLRWIQDDVDRVYEFINTSVSGKWTGMRENGELVYRSVCKGVDGTVTISRTKKGLVIEIDFVKPGKTTPHLLFEINSYKKG